MLVDHAAHYGVQGGVETLYDPVTARVVRGGVHLVYVKKFY